MSDTHLRALRAVETGMGNIEGEADTAEWLRLLRLEISEAPTVEAFVAALLDVAILAIRNGDRPEPLPSDRLVATMRYYYSSDESR